MKKITKLGKAIKKTRTGPTSEQLDRDRQLERFVDENGMPTADVFEIGPDGKIRPVKSPSIFDIK